MRIVSSHLVGPHRADAVRVQQLLKVLHTPQHALMRTAQRLMSQHHLHTIMHSTHQTASVARSSDAAHIVLVVKPDILSPTLFSAKMAYAKRVRRSPS